MGFLLCVRKSKVQFSSCMNFALYYLSEMEKYVTFATSKWTNLAACNHFQKNAKTAILCPSGFILFVMSFGFGIAWNEALPFLLRFGIGFAG